MGFQFGGGGGGVSETGKGRSWGSIRKQVEAMNTGVPVLVHKDVSDEDIVIKHTGTPVEMPLSQARVFDFLRAHLRHS